MSSSKTDQIMALNRYADLIRKQTGRIVRPYRADGYVNLMNKYGTSKDASERYKFVQEPTVPDELLTMYYEGNGLFAKIIDSPAEEAIKHGFVLKDLKDQELENFYQEALEELDWEETVMTAVKWARLFGGSIAVMLINDGRGLEEPLDWKNIRSIDDIRIYDRSVINPDYSSLFNYSADDPFATRGSRLGLPEYYDVYSRYGTFRVHDSRCLVFQNGILPENTTNSEYQLWGMPEYIRLKRAIRDAEIAHGTAPKLLDRSVQAVYKMKGLSAELATEEGEDRVLRRLQIIDMARGLLNSITIDSEGEDYDFRQFQFNGVAEVIDSTCNFLSALTCIPQTILFGRSPAGMNATGISDMENWYNYLERIQKRMVKKNLRYLLSIIFQAGLMTGEIDEVPKIDIEFNPLWSLSEQEKASLEQTKAATQQTKASTAQIYVDMQAIDPSEVRKKLADSEEFDIENMLDEYDEEELFANMPKQEEGGEQMGGMPMGMPGEGKPMENPQETPQEVPQEKTQGLSKEGKQEYEQAPSIEEHDKDTGGNAPAAAPAATKLPQDMSEEEKETAEKAKEEQEDISQNSPKGRKNEDNQKKGYFYTDSGKRGAVGVYVVKNGEFLIGTRGEGDGQNLLCGPGGHIEEGETPAQAAIRETQEEFNITPMELIPIGKGSKESNGLQPDIFLCVMYEGEPKCDEEEMHHASFKGIEELESSDNLFGPFEAGLKQIIKKICGNEYIQEKNLDFKVDSATIKLEDFSLHYDGTEILEDVPDENWVCTNGEQNQDEGNQNSGFHNHPGNSPNIGGSKSIGAWPSDFPKVCIQTNGKKMKDHINYAKAKSGDYQAAKELVEDLVKKERVKQLVDSYPDAIVVPICSAGKGHNQIPIAYADLIADSGLEKESDIQIVEKAHRTGTSEMYRLTSKNTIEGNVKKGKKYIIVDDVVTSGATINEYRQFIEDHGGIVVAATTICMGQAGSNQIAPKEESIEKAVSKHGEERIEKICHKLGINHGLESLTNWQVNYIRSLGSAKIDKMIEEN